MGEAKSSVCNRAFLFFVCFYNTFTVQLAFVNLLNSLGEFHCSHTIKLLQYFGMIGEGHRVPQKPDLLAGQINSATMAQGTLI